MTNLIDFLKQRLREDEDTALAYIDGINVGLESGRYLKWLHTGETLGDYAGHVISYQVNPQALGHIARHDPARVLREVAAKRRILARHTAGEITSDHVYCRACPTAADGTPDIPINECPELRDLAVAYADHPDYNPDWRPA